MKDLITSRKVEDVTIISFSFNEINIEQREQIKKNLNNMINPEDTKFILNLSRVGFLSSLVIATILFFAKEVRETGGEIKLCGLSSESLSIFKITQLDKIFELCDTEEDALASFKKS